MEAIIASVNRKYNLTPSDVFEGDPRVENWLLMNNLGSVLTIGILYLLMVKHGPAFMEKRKPFNLSALMVIYNFAMVILSGYMFYEMMSCCVILSCNLLCQPIVYDNTAIGIKEAGAAWWFFFSKVIELLDTFFFIVRKKNNQVSFLHVYHHSTMMVVCWYMAKYVPGGEKMFAGMFNSLVHVFMYAYYGLAAMGPRVQKYLWWKRYLTTFQMIQFMFVSIRAFWSLFYGPCDYPRWSNVFALVYSNSFLLLFLNFYFKSYIHKDVRTEVYESRKSIQKEE